MRTATIVGETHTSEEKVQTLINLVKSRKYDAIFIEGRENDPLKGASPNIWYVFFLLGWIEWQLLSRIYVSKQEVWKVAQEYNIPIYDRIDASFYQIFLMANRWLRYTAFPFLLIFSLFLINFTIVGYLSLIISPLLFFGLIIWNTIDKRSDYMSQSIITIVNSNNYKNVLISCGSRHAKRIAENLQRAQMMTEIV